MATSTIFNFNFNNSEIVDSTGQWYNATTGTPTTEFIEHDGNTALLQRAYIAGTAYTRDINPVFFQSRDPTFTAHTYTIELQLYPLRDPGGANFGPESGPVLDFNPDADDEKGWVRLNTGQHGSASNTFYWREYGLGPDGSGIPFLTVTAADGTYNRWYSIRIERVDNGTNTGATIKIYVDGTLVVNETLTYAQDALIGRIGDSIRYTYRRSSIDPQGAGAAIDNFKLTAGIAPSRVVGVSLANLQRNNANLLSFIKVKVPTVNDGTLTIQQNGTNVATFTANQSTAATANITVPTAVSELTNDSGYLTASSNLDASKLTSGTVDIARLPQGALERLVKVANEAARYALTTADVQLGDTVQQLDTGIMYVVTDTDHLDSAAGYTEYTAGTAASVPWSGVTGKPTFAAVATSGAYSDLTGTPTIPTVNNATLTIQQNGTTIDTFTANASVDKTINISTADDTKIPLAGSNAISGSLIPARDNSIDIGSSTKNIKMLYTKGITIGGTQFLPSDYVTLSSLATVATSGSYNDLSNKPTIPTVNDATLTIQQNGTTVDTFTANSSTDKTVDITVPTKTSDLTNDSGFITEDTTKIPLAGSNQISGDLIPSTDGTVNLGGSSYQWNNAYIKSLTINGVACGDILTHSASEFVGVSSDQTIGGTKTFSALRTYFGRDISLYSVRKYGKDLNPTSSAYQYLNFSGNLASEGSTNDWSSGYIEQVVDTNGGSRGRWRIQDTAENYVGLELWASGNDKQVRPIQNGNTDLGTTNRKWKSFNGINPGALSLPSNTYISLDTTNFDVTSTTIGTFTPTADGWAILSISQKNKHFGIWLLSGGYRATFHSVYNNGDYFIFALMPVRANVSVDIYCTADDIDSTRKITWLRLFPCQGNV